VTRGLIERQLDGLRRRVPDRWWTPYAVLAGALVAGAVLAQVPLLKLVGTSARAVQAASPSPPPSRPWTGSSPRSRSTGRPRDAVSAAMCSRLQRSAVRAARKDSRT
jgi:hypothetical protein